MNPYLEPHGFLGTGASQLADLTVLAYLLLIIPAMLVGFVFARRKLFRPYHKWTMTTITIVNWLLIAFLMIAAYRFDVAANFPLHPDDTRYLLPVVHGLFGLPAQILATYLVFRMFREDIQVARAKRRGEKDISKYWFKNPKPLMRLTLALWLVTSVLGLLNYLTRYDVIPSYSFNASVIAPAATPELSGLLPPVATQDLSGVQPPASTPELQAPAATPELSAVQPPAGTPEAPVATEDTDSS